MYTTGYLQRLIQSLNVLYECFRQYVKLFQGLGALILFLKRVVDTSEEACDADSVYVMLQNQR
jgi:hypothetical protein